MGHLPIVATVHSRELLVGALAILTVLQWQQHINVTDLLGAIPMLYRHILDVVKINIDAGFTILGCL